MITQLLGSSVLKASDIRTEVDTAKARIAHITEPKTFEDLMALSTFTHAKYRCRSDNIRRLSMASFDKSSVTVKSMDRHGDGDYFV